MHNTAYCTGPNCWLLPVRPVQQTGWSNRRQQNCVLAHEFCAFRSHWSNLVQSKGVGLAVLIHFIVFFLCIFSGCLGSQILLGLTRSLCKWNSYLHCCHPVTTIICWWDTYWFRGKGICHQVDYQWKSALQVEMKTMSFGTYHLRMSNK